MEAAAYVAVAGLDATAYLTTPYESDRIVMFAVAERAAELKAAQWEAE